MNHNLRLKNSNLQNIEFQLYNNYCIIPIVLFWYASAIYQVSLVESWFIHFWKDQGSQAKIPKANELGLLCAELLRYNDVSTTAKFGQKTDHVKPVTW